MRRKYFLVILFLILAIFLSSCGIVTPPITDKIVYRALLVGVGDYIGEDKDLPSPTYSVDRMYKILSQCRFGLSNTEFSVINELKDSDATKKAILDGIASTFSGADSNDVSYFYYTGHGGRIVTSYLCPVDYTFSMFSVFSLISVGKLEEALSVIPGTKIVILDTCHSGGFIGKSRGGLISFNNEVIDTFSRSQPKGLLTTNQYKVLTSCSYNQMCWELQSMDGNPSGIFTMALCTGCGYFDYDYPADVDVDTEVNLQEAYIYVKDWVVQNGYGNLKQDVQVYPDDSDYPVVEY